MVEYSNRHPHASATNRIATELDTQAHRRPRAIVLVSPHNPTGSVIAPAEWDALCSWSSDLGLPLILDEVFAGYESGGGDANRNGLLPAMDRHQDAFVFVLNGLSKRAAMPQAKLAWILCAGSSHERARAAEPLEWVADTYLSPGIWPQERAGAWLDLAAGVRDQINSRIRSNETWLTQRISRRPGWRLLPREGGWYAVVEHNAMDDDETLAAAFLEQQGVLIHPGAWYGIPRDGFFVASLIAAEESWRTGWERILTMEPPG